MNQLSVVKRREFKQLESKIENGIATFIEVGLALRTIRDEKLYIEGFKTFEKYVSERWGFEKRYAYNLIDATLTRDRLCTIVHKTDAEKIQNEAQLRELRDVPDEQLAVVVEAALVKASDEDKPLSARHIREAKAVAEVQPVVASEPVIEQPSAPSIDAAADRARRMIPDLCKSLRLQLGNLGAGRRFDKSISEIEEFAR